MRQEELMIGDWVLRDGEPYQIRQLGIFGVDRDGEDYPAVCVGKPKGIGLIIERNEIGPIPLAAEILEKNFNSKELPDDPYGAYFFGGNDYIEVYIKEYTDGLWQVSVDEVEMGGLPSLRMFVSNVHELQHALRLCGINKEITI